MQNINDFLSSLFGIIFSVAWFFSGTIICVYWAIKGEYTDAILTIVIPFYGIISVIVYLFKG